MTQPDKSDNPKKRMRRREREALMRQELEQLRREGRKANPTGAHPKKRRRKSE